MARTKISEFSATPANNTDIDGINIAEGCAPSGINDAIRELMAQLKDWQSGTSNDPYVIGSSGSLTLNQGTANGVPYLNGSKVVTSGSALTFDGTNFATTGSVTSAGSSNSGNLAFTGTGNRITGDMSNATVSNRVAFQTSTTNSATRLLAIPNGTATVSALALTNNSDPNNASWMQVSAETAECRVNATFSGTGSFLPMTFYTGGSERMRVDTSGNLLLGTSTTRTNYSSGSITPALQIEKAGDVRASITRDSDDASGPVFYLGKTRGTSVNSNTVVASGDNLGLLAFEGTDGTKLIRAASIAGQVDGTPGADDMPGRLVFSTTADGGTSATERMRIDSSGNVGIGTSSPNEKLMVAGAIRSTSNAINWAASDGAVMDYNAGEMRLVAARSGSNSSVMSFTTYNTGTAAERARINSNGSMGIGVSGQSAVSGISGFLSAKNTGNNGWWGLALEQTGTSDCRGIGMSYGYAPNNVFAEYCYFVDTAAVRFVVRSNGGIANYSGNNVNLSDRREKTNFAPAGDYLSKICAIPVQTFNYLDQNMEEDPGTTLGVVAQDVQAVAPELVMESNWGTQEEPKQRLSIYQTDLQYALMKCIQEQQAIITALTARVAALESN